MKKIFTAIIMLLIVFLLVLLGYHYREKLAFPKLLDRFAAKNVPDPSITFIASIESKILRLKVSVACNNEDQRVEILRKKPRIQHIVVNLFKEEQIKKSILNREFGEVRIAILRTINREMVKPVKAVHLEQFFFD
jgi:flagellar basal body-associated protein FliL